VWSLYHLVAPHTNRRTCSPAAFVVSCSSGSTIDRELHDTALPDLPGDERG